MKRITVVMVLIVSVAANAQWTETINGNGKIITKNVSTENYDKIDISGAFNVQLTNGTEGKLILIGEENLLSYLITEVKGNTLEIHFEKGKSIHMSLGKTLVVKVPFESLSGVSLAGSGEVRTEKTIKSDSFVTNLVGSGDIDLTIQSDTIEAKIIGSGDLLLKGTAGTFKSKIIGSGDLRAFDLKVSQAETEVSGSGDAKIYCSESLFARVSGSGDIHFKGDPKKKDTKVSGSGDISKA